MSGRLVLAAAASAALALAASGAQASAAGGSTPAKPFHISYSINLPNFAVSDVVMLEQGAPNPFPNGYGLTSSNPPWSAGIGGTTLTDPFVKTNPIVATFLMGVTSNLPGDAQGQQHLVLFTNDAFATDADGIAFGTLFPNTDEDTLIEDLAVNLESPDSSTSSQAVSDIFSFADNDAVSGTDGTIAFAPGDHFTAIAFSGGQIIGGGVSFTASVPEPASWATMLIGMGCLGAFTRVRRRRLPAVS